MLRTFVSAAIAVALCANLALAADKADKKGTTVTGIVKKVDADKKVITVTVRKSKTESEDKEYKIEETTKFVVISGTDKQELTAKEGIKNEQLKEGAGIAITVDESGKVTQVQFGSKKKAAVKADKADKKKATTVTGTVKKIDADKNVITVTVRKSKTETEDKEFKIEESTKFVVLSGDDKKELTPKEGFKNENLKEGASIALTLDESGKVTQVQFGKGKKKGDK